MSDKVRLTTEFIKECLAASANPVCLCSFGKDSLVMLHIILQIKKIPVIYWREPFYQTKFHHAQKIAEEWDLTIYDYPPSICNYVQIEDYFDVFNFYYVNGTDWINLYTGTRNIRESDKNYLCALKNLLQRPKITNYDFKWDCIFHGQKDVDPIYIGESIKLNKLKVFGRGIMGYPINDWTNENIWRYIKQNNLPYNKERYENKNETFNNDLFPTCHKCLDYREIENIIICPKSNKEIKFSGKTQEQHKQYIENLLAYIRGI
ncbi:MAG: phosphoadenosine phosphosulfate reductase family protein [Bacteroidetes bacterium]|nr:phosphoadenosine phosphosulfate reductase family protein [Bacteroidota bacterium]